MRLFRNRRRSSYHSVHRSLFCEDLESRALLAADALTAEIALAEGEEATKVPDFLIKDVNPNSSTYNTQISPRHFEGQISAWYFGHAT